MPNHYGLLNVPQNWWEGNLFRMPPALPKPPQPTYNYVPQLTQQALPPDFGNLGGGGRGGGMPGLAQGPAEKGDIAGHSATQDQSTTTTDKFGEFGMAALGLANPALASMVGLTNAAVQGYNAPPTDLLGLIGGLLGRMDPESPQVTGLLDKMAPDITYSDVALDLAALGFDVPGINSPQEPSQFGGDPSVGPADTGGQIGGGADVGDPGTFRRGGMIPSDRDHLLEAVPIRAHEGEYVLRPEAAKHYGKGLLDALNTRSIDKKKLRGLLG